METPLDRYLREHSIRQTEALDWLERQTNIRTNYPRMLSGSVQGALLKLLVEISGARNVLEIGSFTGYSAICMAYGLPQDGHIDALEINDELEALMRQGWEKAGVSDRITLHIGDARHTLERFSKEAASGDRAPFDFAFIDANKREYCDYYELVMPLLKSGGVLVADDVLWDGKVYADPVPADAQTAGLLRFNDLVSSDPGVETVILPLRDGISVIRKK